MFIVTTRHNSELRIMSEIVKSEILDLSLCQRLIERAFQVNPWLLSCWVHKDMLACKTKRQGQQGLPKSPVDMHLAALSVFSLVEKNDINEPNRLDPTLTLISLRVACQYSGRCPCKMLK